MDVISAGEAAKLLKVTRRRVNALIASGRLPAQKVGNSHVIQRADLAKVKHRRPGRPAAPTGKGRAKNGRK
jgi:excisionase family DNA binding protein